MKRVLLLVVLSFILLPSIMAAADCSVKATNTVDFFKEIPDFNAKLADCNLAIPSPVNNLLKNDLVNVQVVRNNGSKDVFMIKVENKMVKSIELGSSNNPTYVATLAECALDNVLQAEDKAGALAYLYSKKHLTIGPHGAWRNIIFNVVMFFARGAVASNAKEIPTTCPKKPVGQLCNHGGECETGNCIGVVPGKVYMCSCDAFRYVAGDTEGKCPKN